jgi:putative DNA primase/helicase
MKTITKMLRAVAAFSTAMSPKATHAAQPPAAANEARPGRCGNIMTLLAHLCDLDHDLRLWVLRWLAYPLRNPGAKMSTALVFNGGEGSGKSLFLNFVVAELYGTAAAKIRPRGLHSRFDGWVDGVSLALIEGEFARPHLARIKEAMTAGSFAIEREGHAPNMVQNQLNFIYVNSSPDFLPADVGNRRFLVIEVPPARQRAFYQAVVHEITEGGVDAFRDYLMHCLDMGRFNEHTPPPTGMPNADRRAA